MRNPSVSGALAYKELCMATRNEERRQAEMRKREQYRTTRSGDGSQRAPHHKRVSDKEQGDQPASKIHWPGMNVKRKPRPSTEERRTPRMPKSPELCYNCGKPGHFRRDCRSRKSESKGKQDRSVNRQVMASRDSPFTSHCSSPDTRR